MNDYNDLTLEQCKLILAERDMELEKVIRENQNLKTRINQLTTVDGVKKARCWTVQGGKVVELGVKKDGK